jgi:DNA helicase-2/ATP-dependent DNA helicase PcrA
LAIVSEIRDLVEQRGFKYSDLAVLYRANFQSRPLEEVFSQHKIPYHIENGLNFYQRREVKVLLDYLRLINAPETEQGDEALLSVINVPNRYIGRKFNQELQEFASTKGLHLYPALKEMPIELQYIRKNVREFLDDIDLLIAQELEPAEVIHLLRSSLDYDRHITDEDIPSPDDQKIRNVDQLQMSATRYDDIGEFLLYTESFEDKSVSDNKEGVSLMTVHKSKGLEFPVIFMVGMIEGILPSKKGDLEEERRIAFVGISRAMKLLYLSHTHSYLNVASKRSIFLDEILGQKSVDAASDKAA